MKRFLILGIMVIVPLAVAAQNMQFFNETLYEKVEKDEKDEKQGEAGKSLNDVTTFPGFTDLLGKNVLLPQLEIKGLTNFNSGDNFYGDIRLFTSAFTVKNFSNISLLFPDASIYGVSMSFNWLPFHAIRFTKINGESHDINWFCAYFNANYLGKNLQGITKNVSSSDTARFTSDVGHIKVGLQVIPKINTLSFYVDINFLLPVVNRDQLLLYSPLMKKGSSNFLQFGTKFFIAKGDEKPLNIFVDLSGVLVDKVTKTIYQTNDALIPRLSIGGSAKF